MDLSPISNNYLRISLSMCDISIEERKYIELEEEIKIGFTFLSQKERSMSDIYRFTEKIYDYDEMDDDIVNQDNQYRRIRFNILLEAMSGFITANKLRNEDGTLDYELKGVDKFIIILKDKGA